MPEKRLNEKQTAFLFSLTGKRWTLIKDGKRNGHTLRFLVVQGLAEERRFADITGTPMGYRLTPAGMKYRQSITLEVK